MFLLEWGIGVLVGWWGSRTGMVSIFSILLIIPFLPWSFHAWFVIGVASSLVASPSLSPFRSADSVLGLLGGFLGVLLYSSFHSYLPPLDGIVPFLMMGMVALILLFSPHSKWKLFIGIVLSLALGYWVLVRWVIPLGVSSILMGLSGLRPLDVRYSTNASLVDSTRDAGIGILAGLIPGIGPGLIGLVGGHFSPALGIANLVFSMGLVSISSSVRSAPAAALAFQLVPAWTEVMFGLVLGIFLAGLLHALFPPAKEPSSILQSGVTLLILACVGGWLAVGCAFLAWGVERFFFSHGIPSELGLLFLVPPIWLFYA